MTDIEWLKIGLVVVTFANIFNSLSILRILSYMMNKGGDKDE